MDLIKQTDTQKRERENKSYACPALWQRLTINATGEVIACCRDAGKRLTLGNLDEKKDNLIDIWNGENLKKARDLHEQKKAYLLDACNGCDHIRGMIAKIINGYKFKLY